MLDQIDLDGKGRFGRPGGSFTVTDPCLERPWHYLYTNEQLLLKVSNYGPVSCQVAPPGGMMLFTTPRTENSLPFQIFVECNRQCRTAFVSPLTRRFLVDYRCEFLPDMVRYVLTYPEFEITTVIGLADGKPGLFWHCTIRNCRAVKLKLKIMPVWRVFHAPASLAPWDMPELYQTCGFFNDRGSGVWVESRDPAGRSEERSGSFMVTDLPVAEADLSYRAFAGAGNMIAPDKLGCKLTLDCRNAFSFAQPDEQRLNIGAPGVGAMRSPAMTLEPGGELAFSLSLFHASGWSAADRQAGLAQATKLLQLPEQQKGMAAMRRTFEAWTGQITYHLPDSQLAQYLQTFVPWQLYWVGKLDRGWPTGMRGTRDAAQDYSAIAWLDPAAARKLLLDIFCCQKSDGGFLRQFAVSGPDGRHDCRDYVDSGCWVFELLYDYMRLTGDRDILDRSCRYLESPAAETVARHAQKLLAYYLDDFNHGEHGLVLIREGDWNDAMNTAGLQLRGESVMVSCQVVFLLQLAQEIFPEAAGYYERQRLQLRQNIRQHALNADGFLNGVFNDDGKWLFSAADPDGQRRVNSAVNAWGVIAKIFEPSELPQIFAALTSLKGPCGYRLFYPPLGKPPIAMAGRLGTGDLAAGLCENGTVYNHGSQGFLLRAAGSAGRQDLILDIIKYSLNYDQKRHPVRLSKSEPYAIVNCYNETPGATGEGGTAFLSGTISTVFRAFLEQICGIVPHLEELEISPCLPSEWDRLHVSLTLRGCPIDLSVIRTGSMALTVNGVLQPGNRIKYGSLDPVTANRIQICL